MADRRVFHQGVEYLSTGAAASVLGVSVRTVKRYERAGRLTRCQIPRGIRGQHWYRRDEVEQLAARLPAPELGAGSADVLPFAAYTQPGPRSVRAGDDWISPAEERDGPTGVELPRVAPQGPLYCPGCGGEVVIRSRGIRGARPELNELYWCDRCQAAVDVSEPAPPDPNLCPHCGDEVIREWRRDEAGDNVEILTCDTHGDLGTAPPKPQLVERPFQHQGGLPTLRPVEVSRGKRARAWPGPVVGAVRKPPPPPGPPQPTWLPPYELGH